jgi:DeoR/GlpR family transcriptional regulator of sugar metabolism
MHALASLSDFDVVIVDAATPAEHVNRLRNKGINVVVAPVAGRTRHKIDKSSQL